MPNELERWPQLLLRHVAIAHHIRGRIRLKLQLNKTGANAAGLRLERPQAQIDRFQCLLRQIPGIQTVELNWLARSCTVHYDPQTIPDRA